MERGAHLQCQNCGKAIWFKLIMKTSFKPILTALAATCAGVVLLTAAARAQTIPNPSFEADAFTVFPGYCSANGGTITGWTVAGAGIGLNPAGGSAAFADNGLTPQGANVAFIQTVGTTNTLSTTITGLTPGVKYAVTCRANARVGLPPTYPYATPTMWLGVNGGEAQPFVVPAVAAMGSYTTPYYLATATFVATNTTAALSVSSYSATDGALLLDDFNITALSASLWSVSAWTNDASTGVDATNTLCAYRFGSTTTASINRVNFTGVTGVNPSVAGSFAVAGELAVYPNTLNHLTALGGSGSAELAKNFLYGGNPGTLTLSNLIMGTTYRLSLFGVGYDLPGNRNVVGSGGGDLLNVDEDQFGLGDGVRVDYTFVANATNNVVTLTPFYSVNTFHLFGFALTQMNPVIATQPASVVAFAGTPAQLTVLATSPTPLFYQWHSVSRGIIPDATNAVLSWSSLASSNGGAYFVVVTNAYGTATSSNATVTVLGGGLTNQTAALGGATAFDSGITNLGSYTCQWRHNGTNLPDSIITTVAGNGGFGFSGDGGAAINATMQFPSGVAVDGAGNLFIADRDNNRIRQVGTNGLITTVAGYAGWNRPNAVTVDGAGNLFIADKNNHRICKVGTNGSITTVAGSGNPDFSGDGAAAVYAALNTPRDVFVDGAGNLFIADCNNSRIRKVGTNGLITTVAGIGNGTFYSGDGGAATNAGVPYPNAVTMDGAGNLFIADSSHRIRKVGTNGIITTVAGNGNSAYTGDGGAATSAGLNAPVGVTVDGAGNLFIADYGNNRIRKVGTNGIITTVAGNGTAAYAGDGGAATNAALYYPAKMAVNGAGSLFIADSWNGRIRKVAQLSGPVLRIENISANDLGDYTLILFNTATGLSITSSVVNLSQASFAPPILANLAVIGGSVGFTLNGDSGQTVVVETCTNLAAPVWVPVQTNTLGSSPVNFSALIEPQSPGRFYRLRTP
jgi:sugar lactone lactonase YvrE